MTDRRRLELFVRRHPHVLLHVVGLVARRGFHLDGIVFEPTDDHRLSRVVLLVQDAPAFPQLLKQLRKLHDVVSAEEPGGAQRAA